MNTIVTVWTVLSLTTGTGTQLVELGYTAPNSANVETVAHIQTVANSHVYMINK
jgi:hypothetical protein